MKHLNIYEREQISIGFAQYLSRREIAKKLNRHHTTISRELNNNGKWYHKYSACIANERAFEIKKRPRRFKKIENNEKLKKYIHDKLELRWSPEQIAQVLKRRYPNNTHMRVSHETIYTYIYLLPRGELRKELISYLRQGSEGRRRRYRTTEQRGKILNMVSIHERPEESKGRTIGGHWESDLIVGKDHASAIGTIVERTTRTTLIVPLKAKDAETVRISFSKAVKHLPKEIMKSITHDRGHEMSQHELFTKDTKIQVYFADPYSPWQRGTNENTNGLIRQFFPKGTDFNIVSNREIKHVQKLLNERPRKVLNWKTPKEAFRELIDNGAIRV
jgi:transposase, IS30 family